MTNYEKFINMSIREFAKSRLQWDGEFGQISNDTINSYGDDEDEIERAIQDEVEWLNQEVINEEEYNTQDELSDIWNSMDRSE